MRTADGKEYELKAVKVGVIKKLWPRFETMKPQDLTNSLDVLGAFVDASAGVEGLADAMTADELQAAFMEALKLSGLAAKPQGETSAP